MQPNQSLNPNPLPSQTHHNLSYPVLCLSRDTSVSVAESPQRLQRCNALAFFRNRYFNDLLILDAQAAAYRVVRAELAPPLSGVGKYLARAFNRRLEVRLELCREAPPCLAAAKAHVLAWLEKAPEFWEASRDLREWRQRVEAAPDMHQLIALFV